MEHHFGDKWKICLIQSPPHLFPLFHFYLHHPVRRPPPPPRWKDVDWPRDSPSVERSSCDVPLSAGLRLTYHRHGTGFVFCGLAALLSTAETMNVGCSAPQEEKTEKD